MNTKEFFDFCKQNGMTNDNVMDFISNPEECYLINIRQIADKLKKDGFYSDEVASRLNSIFDDLNITLGQLDLFFHNYEEDLKAYLLTGNMNKDVLMLLKNNFYSSNQIARQFVKWINKWADDTKANLYHLKKENFLKWITCVDEVEFFRCIHCDNYKKKIETTLTDDEDLVFFKENKNLFKQQLYCILNFDIDKSLELMEEIRQKRVTFDKMIKSNSEENIGDKEVSLEEIILDRIEESKRTKNNQLIMLPSGRHAIHMINHYPFNISIALIYHSEKDKSIDLSSDNIIGSIGVRYSDSNKEVKKNVDELIDVYDDTCIYEEAVIEQWRKSK